VAAAFAYLGEGGVGCFGKSLRDGRKFADSD